MPTFSLTRRSTYVGIGQATANMAKIRHVYMRAMGDVGEHAGLFMVHETDVPLRDAFTSRWGDFLGDALD